MPDSSDVFVLLSRAGSGLVAVRVGEHQVGFVSQPDSEAFCVFVDEGIRRDRPVVTAALRVRVPAASWHIRVYWPPAVS